MSRALIEDTRQQAGQHEAKNEKWRGMEVNVLRHQLEVGDYALMPIVSVDTKKDLIEFVGNLTNDHKRFSAECARARDYGCRLVILVENEEGLTSIKDLQEWTEPDWMMKKRRGRARANGSSLAKMCRTMHAKYGTRFGFCTPEESAERVLRILEREEESYWMERLGLPRSSSCDAG